VSTAVVILTHNEAVHIGRAIDSVADFASEVLVVDSGSTDDTVDIARRKGARVAKHAWVNYAQQFQWALDQGGIGAEWILRLDADEVIETDLAARLRDEVPKLGPDVTGVTFDRKQIFMGRWVRHGGRYPLRLLRLIRRGQGRIEQRWMDEHLMVEGGRIVHFAGGFADCNLKGLGFFIDKHNGYASREAIDVLALRHGLVDATPTLTQATSRQASLTRRFKEALYNRLPFAFSALAYFLMRYTVQLGFLDGRAGLVYHVLQGFWYRFLVGAKVMEYERALSGSLTKAEKRDRLRALSGLRL
jgi:glycosyltransferase involved in cell wall biosynthesis